MTRSLTLILLLACLSGCLTRRSSVRDITTDTFTDKNDITHVVKRERTAAVTVTGPGWVEINKMNARMILHERDAGGLDVAMDDKIEALTENPAVAKAIVDGFVQGLGTLAKTAAGMP